MATPDADKNASTPPPRPFTAREMKQVAKLKTAIAKAQAELRQAELKLGAYLEYLSVLRRIESDPSPLQDTDSSFSSLKKETHPPPPREEEEPLDSEPEESSGPETDLDPDPVPVGTKVPLRLTIASILSDHRPRNAKQVYEELLKRDLLPATSDPLNYIRSSLGQYFARTGERGFYTLKESVGEAASKGTDPLRILKGEPSPPLQVDLESVNRN